MHSLALPSGALPPRTVLNRGVERKRAVIHCYGQLFERLEEADARSKIGQYSGTAHVLLTITRILPNWTPEVRQSNTRDRG